MRNLFGQEQWERRGESAAAVSSLEARIAALETLTGLYGERLDELDNHVEAINAQLALINTGAWTSWTPTLTQGGSVAKTTTRAVYVQIGKLVIASCKLIVTGSGIAANIVTVSLPVPAATATGNLLVGSGYIFDASTTTSHSGPSYIQSTSTAAIVDEGSTSSSNVLGISGFTAGLAVNDQVSIFVAYEAA